MNREVLRMNRIDFFRRLGKLVLGLFLFALGIVVTMKANLGFGPWEVFHQGVSGRVGIDTPLQTAIGALYAFQPMPHIVMMARDTASTAASPIRKRLAKAALAALAWPVM